MNKKYKCTTKPQQEVDKAPADYSNTIYIKRVHFAFVSARNQFYWKFLLTSSQSIAKICPKFNVRSDVAVFVMVKFHLSQTSGIMYVSNFREWQPLECKHEAKAGNAKPYGKSQQIKLDMTTRETYVRIAFIGNMRKEVEYA